MASTTRVCRERGRRVGSCGHERARSRPNLPKCGLSVTIGRLAEAPAAMGTSRLNKYIIRCAITILFLGVALAGLAYAGLNIEDATSTFFYVSLITIGAFSAVYAVRAKPKA